MIPNALPERILTLLEKYENTLTSTSSSLDSLDTEASLRGEVSRLKSLVDDLASELSVVKSELVRTVEFYENSSGDVDEDFDSDSEEVVAIGADFMSLLTKKVPEGASPVDVYSEYGSKSYFQELDSNSTRYAVAIALCNFASTRGKPILPIWSNLSLNNGQLED